MKKKIKIISLLLCFGVFGQKEVAKKVNELITKNVAFKPYSVLSAIEQIPDKTLNKAVKKSTVAKINLQSVANLMANKEEYIQVQIPYQSKTIEVQLYKVNLFAEGFHVDTDKSKSIAYNQGIYYRGIVKGDSNSTVSLNFFKIACNIFKLGS